MTHSSSSDALSLSMATPNLAYVRGAPFHEMPGPFLCISGTDFHYMPAGKIYEDLTCTKEFTRLAYIKQLGLVGSSFNNACQDQTRYFHSFVTGAMMDLVLCQKSAGDHQSNARKSKISGTLKMFAFSSDWWHVRFAHPCRPFEHAQEYLDHKIVTISPLLNRGEVFLTYQNGFGEHDRKVGIAAGR